MLTRKEKGLLFEGVQEQTHGSRRRRKKVEGGDRERLKEQNEIIGRG